MTSTRGRVRPSLRYPVVSLLCVGALVPGLAGCSQEPPPEPDSGLSGAAIDACLAAAAEHNSYPVDGPGATTVTARPDDQGWWAVVARVEVDGRTEVLTCTAVPDDDGVVGASSWNIEEE